MLYLTIIVVIFLILFFQIYKIEGVENKHLFIFVFGLALMCHLKLPYTFLHLHK